MIDLLTLREAADYLGCGATTLKRRVAAGELRVFRDGRLVRVRRVDLDRYVAAHLQRSVPPAGAVPAGRRVEGRLWD